MNRSFSLYLASSLILAAGVVQACGDDGRGRGAPDGSAGDGGATCASDGDCDDGFACTVDSCGVGGTCRFDTIDERCTAPQVCEVGRGCVDEASCTTDEDCDDSVECTIDSCGVGGECRNSGVDERCPDVGSLCDPTTGDPVSGCTEAMGCTADAECDDSVECTLDACGVDNMCDNMPINERCDTGEVCTATGCFASMDCTTDDECQDGNFCNGAEFCMPEFGCQPAPAPRMCDDSDDCTMDSCDADSDMCVFRCDSSRAECMCPAGEAPCDGTFAITPPPSGNCAFGMVNFNITSVAFSCLGDILSVSASTASWSGTAMTQTPRPAGADFDVEAVIAGGCEEHYRLHGAFVDADTFEATFDVDFIETMPGHCTLSSCAPSSRMVTGTRM